jgi:hypothetical protein
MPLNFGEIKQQLTQHLEFEDALALVDATTRARELNDAYLQLSTEHKMHLVTLQSTVTTVPPALTAIPKPVDFYQFLPDGFYYDGARMVGITIAEAFDYDSNWNNTSAKSGTPVYYIHDSIDNLVNIKILPRETYLTPIDYYLKYVAYPARMVADADVPWSDQFRPFNDIIALMAASKILAGGKGNEFLTTSQFFRNRAAERTADLSKMLTRNRVTTTRLLIGNSNIPSRRRPKAW